MLFGYIEEDFWKCLKTIYIRAWCGGAAEPPGKEENCECMLIASGNMEEILTVL